MGGEISGGLRPIAFRKFRQGIVPADPNGPLADGPADRGASLSLPVGRAGYISPAVSGKPHRMLKHCTAWPLAPLTMLSTALITMSRPVRASRRQATSITFLPITFPE